MIELMQSMAVILLAISSCYQHKNFQLMDDRLRELELKYLEYLHGKNKGL